MFGGAAATLGAAAAPGALAAPATRSIARAAGELAGGPLPLTIGLGTCLVSDGDATEQVSLAVDAGYRVFDTAQRYANEAGVGRALRAAIAAGAVRREELFVTTKVWCDNMGQRATAPSVARSSRLLDLGPIDLVLIHWPGDFVRRAGASPDQIARNADLRRATWSELERLQRAGAVRRIGVSNFSERHLRELLSFAKVRPAVNQFEIHPYNSRPELVELCEREGIPVEAYSPLGGKGNRGAVTDLLLKDATLAKAGRAHGKTPAQVALRWSLQRGITPIPKASSKKRIAENLDVFDFELTSEEMRAINSLNRDQFVLFDADDLA